MKKILFIISTSILLFGCEEVSFERADPNEQIGKVDTLAIYWKPIDYDTIRASIIDRFTYSGDDTLKYLPSNRDLTLRFDFSGKMKEYMKHGKMIVRPFDSSVFVQRIDNNSFKLNVNKPIDGWKISMYYEISFAQPYFFSYIFDGTNYTVKPNDTILLFMRSEMTQPVSPWDYN